MNNWTSSKGGLQAARETEREERKVSRRKRRYGGRLMLCDSTEYRR